MVQPLGALHQHFSNRFRHSNRLKISWNDDGDEVKMTFLLYIIATYDHLRSIAAGVFILPVEGDGLFFARKQ